MNCTIDWKRLNATAPARAGDLAYQLFCRPRYSPYFPSCYKTLAMRARGHLQNALWQQVPASAGPLQTYVFEPDLAQSDKSAQAKGTAGGGKKSAGSSVRADGQNILLVHGWTSEAAFMSAFIEPLRRQGHRLVLFDLPAHGRSFGRRANLIELARSVVDVAAYMGPFDSVIAHSMGGMAALLAAEGAEPLCEKAALGRHVLIASPNHLKTVTMDYGKHLGLNKASQTAFEQRLERVGHRSVSSCVAAKILPRLGVSSLIVHSKDDARVAFADAQAITKASPMSELAPFDHLGHANVLFAPPVVRAVRTFCTS